MTDKKKKILLIDNNEIVRIMLSNLFWLHGLDEKYELATIARMEDAERIISDVNTRPDIIFTGLVMPHTKDGKTRTSADAGFSLLHFIKDNPETKNIHVIIFSSYGEKEYQDQALALGANMYLKKSDNMPQDLINVITSFDNK